MATLWAEVIQQRLAPSAKLVFVGHSNGGHCLSELLQAHGSEVLSRTAAIALTDALWQGKSWTGQPQVINWVASGKPTGTAIEGCPDSNLQRSAGSREHVYTTHAARGDFWPWLDAQVGTPSAEQTGEVHGEL